MKKGQGAMEYLMTYGWALLVIVVVGAALFALGVLDPSTYQGKRCQGFATFTYQDHLVNSTHLSLDVINGASEITVTGMSVGGTALANIVTTPVNPQSAGSRFVVRGDLASTVGASYNHDVVVTYDVTNGIQGNSDSGTCIGTVA